MMIPSKPNKPKTRIRARSHPLTPVEAAPRYGPPIAPVTISRIPIFAPVARRGREETTWTGQTPWGSVTISGRLTQLHRQLLDAAIATCLLAEPMDDGGMRLVMDPYRVTRAMGTGTWDYRWLESLLRDLRRAEITVREHGHDFPLVVTGILTAYGRYDRQRRLHPGLLSHRGDDRRDMIYLTLSGPWWALWGDRPSAHYARLVQQIAQLSPIGQAVVRLCYTQPDEWRIGIDKALQTVGAWDEGPSRVAQERRRRARRELERDQALLGELGVALDLDARQIAYHRPRDVYVSRPGPTGGVG